MDNNINNTEKKIIIFNVLFIIVYSIFLILAVFSMVNPISISNNNGPNLVEGNGNSVLYNSLKIEPLVNYNHNNTNKLKNINDDFTEVISKAISSVVSIETDSAEATGFIISPDGYIVTNVHVIKDAKYIKAITNDKVEHTAELIGEDPNLDIALLKVDGYYPYLELKNSDDIMLGEKVIAIGNPRGLGLTVTEGIVSAINRKGSNNLSIYIQTDAALNPGNSGGPLIDAEGKVIGINTFKISSDENLGFALESNYIRKGVKGIIKDKPKEITLGE